MASSAGRTVFFPAGSPAGMVPELGNQVHLVVSLRRELFPPVDPSFNAMRTGAFFGQMSAALNAVLTAAIMKSVAVYWETVYDAGLPDWEQCNRGTPPGDVRIPEMTVTPKFWRGLTAAHRRTALASACTSCVGKLARALCPVRCPDGPQVGPMHEIGGLTEDLNDMLDNAGQALAQRRRAQGPPLPGSIITANSQGVWKLAVFSQQAMPIASDEKVEAIFLGDQTFDQCVRRGSLLLPPGLTAPSQVVPPAGQRDESSGPPQCADSGSLRAASDEPLLQGVEHAEARPRKLWSALPFGCLAPRLCRQHAAR